MFTQKKTHKHIQAGFSKLCNPNLDDENQFMKIGGDFGNVSG